MDQVDEFQTCRRCRHPYPVFRGAADPGACPPCRKRARARSRGVEPDLTTSDRAYDAIHAMYSKRDAGWRNRLDGVEGELARVTQVAGELSDENVRLRAQVAHLEATNAHLTDRLERQQRPAGTPREVQNLRMRLGIANRTIEDLRSALRRAVAQNIIGGATRALDLKTALPDGVSVKDLIKLCHPDRHASGALEGVASEVTKWLITKR